MFTLPLLHPDEVLLYLRKSRTDDPALTVAEVVAKHEQMLDDWSMRTWGETVPEHNRFREIVSGETIEARPEIRKVLRLIEQDRYKAILIVEPQRLSRGDLEDIGRISKLLRYTHTLVITLQYSYDLSDERDRDYFERELKRGNEYLEYSKRIMANGRVLSVENGNYIGSRDPYGYRRIKVKDGSRWCHTLEIVEDEAETVRLIFRMYAEGKGATAICTRLNSIGSKTKSGAQWTPPTIYGMLDNTLYIGMVKWQARKTVKVVEDGEIIKRSPRNKDHATFAGRHPAIIDDALWQAARARREARAIPRANVSGELKNPLSGLVQCKCGHFMIRRPYHGRCADRLQCPNMTYCGNASCTMDEITEQIAGILRNSIADFRIKMAAADDIAYAEHEAYKQQIAAHIAELEQKEASIWEKYAEGMPKHIFDGLLDKNQTELRHAKEMLLQAESELPVPTDYAEKIMEFTAALEALQDDSKNAATQNELLKRCIRKLTYSRKRGKRGKSSGECRRGWDTQPMQISIELNL